MSGDSPYTLFISDLHLDPSRPAVTRALATFLQQHAGCDALYILGDLFEAWLGDDDDSPLAEELGTLLCAFSRSGSRLVLMHGNRDFLLGEAFCRRIGADLLDDPAVIDLYGQATLLMHGDSLCTTDVAYQEFRKTARNPQWQADLLSRPLQERRDIAAHLRSVSKESNSNKAQDIMDVTPDEVERCLVEHNVQRLIHGHTHRPAHHKHTAGERWVLGDWEQKGWAIRVEQENIDLYNFDIIQ